MQPPEHSPRDLTDRVFRKTLENVDNLQECLEGVLPDHVASLNCARARLLQREFVSPDWRGHEADLLFEIPYRASRGARRALVCLLIEHQSRTDVLMPLRTLLLTTSFWDREWREWQEFPVPRPEFRLTPVIPIVLYTGPTLWGSTRRLTELLGEPEAFHAFAPHSEPIIWNLADHTPEELLNRGDGWRNLLAVMRNELADETDFRRVAREAIQRLDSLYAKDRSRWQELIEALLIWSYARRPAAERVAFQAEAEAALGDPLRKEEIHTMVQSIADSYFAEGELRAAREMLKRILVKRFVTLSPEIQQRIEVSKDLEKLHSCAEKVFEMKSLEELPL